MHSFLFLCLDCGNVLSESVDILRLVDLDSVVSALLNKILDSSLCLVTKLHSCRIRKVECILISVQVDEVS